MAKKILIDVPPIHDDGLKVFEKISDIEIIRFDRANQSLEDEIKDVDAVMVGLAIFNETKNSSGGYPVCQLYISGRIRCGFHSGLGKEASSDQRCFERRYVHRI